MVKEMVGVSADEGGRRRLPLWMMGNKSADKVKEFDNGGETNQLEKENLSKPCRAKAKTGTIKHGKAVMNLERENLEVNSCFLAKCETKKSKRKLNLQGVESDDNIAETVLERKISKALVREVRESTRRRQKTKRISSEGTVAIETSSLSEGDDELTMEDLMSFAEEYVKGDKDMEQQQLSSREGESDSQLPMKTSSRSESGGSIDFPNNNSMLSSHKTVRSYSSTEPTTSQGVIANASRTGDPAQDMLDLFLGPLLKKPLEEEKRLKFDAVDLAFANEFKKQSQNDNVGDEMVPFVEKKKSSLKDKVAMFLV